jgi:hypothetical protein
VKPFLRAAGLIVVLLARAAVPGPAAPPGQIARWIQDLGADDYATRQKASDALWAAGAAAEPALEAALRSKDPEVVRRAREILAKFRTGIYPDTPPRVVALIRQFQAGDPSTRQSLVRDFCKQGRAGLAAVRKLAALEENVELRTSLVEQIARESGHAAGAMLAAGDVAGAEGVLEASLDPAQPASLRSYAAFHLLRGTVDDRVRQLRPRAEGGDRKAAAVLAYLCRAQGDLPAARRAAERSGDNVLLGNVLAEQGDCPALLRLRDSKRDGPQGPALALALNATQLRLAGRSAESDAVLAKLARQPGWPSALAYFFNDRPEEAIAALRADKQQADAFQFLALQLRYREAFELADRAKPEKAEQKLALAIARARALAGLGEKDAARRLLAGLTEDLNGGDESPQYGPLLKADTELGFRDRAIAHAAHILTRPQPERHTGSVFDGLFGDRSAAAALWWGMLRHKSPKEDVPATLQRLRGLFDDHKPGPDFEALAAAEADVLARQAHERDQSAGSEQYQTDLASLADVCVAAGKEALAQSLLEKAAGLAGDPTALRRLADFLADRGRWSAAADRYAQAWEKERGKPVLLYLKGWALTKAGQAGEGRQLMEQAHLLALADDEARYDLAETLSKRGLTEAAVRELDVLLRTAEFRSVYLTNALADLLPEAVRRRDYARASAFYQRVALGVLETGATFVDQEAYLTVPHAVHLNRARALLAAGRLDEARPEIETCLTLLPGDVELPIAAVPVLTGQGRKAEAEALYARVAAVHEKVCAGYPRCASSHNELAWLAARCRRDLDGAWAHARRAVELGPRETSYLDTLAEVYFQRGDRARAIGLMKKCLEMEPKKEFYRQQLRRFEAGDPAAEIPGER